MAGSLLPIGTVTFVFTDIEGSTRLVQQLGDQFGSALSDHHRIMRDAIDEGGGVVVSTEGDAFFAAFASVPRAVAAVAAVQCALASRAWPGGAQVRVRIGIHTGEAVLGGDNYVGIDVHRAARIAAAGHGGQVLLSATTMALVANNVPDRVTVVDLGDHQLKDLAQAEHLYQLAIEGLPVEFPPIRSIGGASRRLPTPITDFIGRSDELDVVATLVDSPGLVTLLGTGGSGKTRLAIEVGHKSAGLAGLDFVDLSATSNPVLLASFVASAMSIIDSATTPAQELVVNHIGTSRYLLILDNCEHMTDATAELITHLLERCPRLTVLATSREILGVAGEQVHHVGGLSVEDEGNPSDAVQLFVERASAVSPDLDAEHWAPEITELCRRLDGIPLAIELAAARANVLTPRDILERLDDRFVLLRTRSTTAASRHQSLEAAIGWSYDSLDPAEQFFLCHLSVFRGGFTLWAAEAVSAADTDTLGLLTSLIERSLVSFRSTMSGARYSLLETIREYAALQLETAGETAAAMALHRDFFMGWAKDQARRVGGTDQLAALDDLEADHDNLRAVIERQIESDDTESALAMAATLVWFWYVHSHFTEGEHWSDVLLAKPHGQPTRARLRLLIGSGDFDFRIGEPERAAAKFTEALEGARHLGSRSLEMWALAYTGTNDLLRLKPEDASRSLAAGLEIANELGDMSGVGYCTFMEIAVSGWVAELNDQPELIPPLSEKLNSLAAMVRAAGERNMIGHVMQTVGMTAHWMGQPQQAAVAFDESLAAFAQINTVACASHCLEAIAVFTAPTHPATTAQLLSASESLRERVGVKAPPIEQEIRRQASEAAAARLGAVELDEKTEQGSRLTMTEATALARQTLGRIR